MRIINSLTFFVLSFFISLPALAQNSRFPGFYVTTGGERVNGVFTDYRQWGRSPADVHFLPHGATTEIILTPVTCRQFSVEGYDTYLAYTGKRMTNPIGNAQDVIKRSETSEDQYADVQLFLRQVVYNENIELYVLADDWRTNFFYRLPGQALTELKFKEYYDQTQIRVMPEYRQQLRTLFAEDIEKQKLEWRLEQLTYAEEGLEDFFKRLFPTEKTTAFRKPESRWVIAGGAALTFFRVVGESSAVEIGQKYSTSVSPLLTIAYQRSFKRHLNKYFFYPQVRFFRYQSGAESRNVNIRTTIDFSSSLVVLPELNVGVNLLNKEHLSYNISAGVGVMNILKNHHVRKRYSEGVQEPYFITETNLSKATIAMNISTGLVLSKKLVLAASYLLPTTTGRNIYFFIKSSGVQLRMGYLL